MVVTGEVKMDKVDGQGVHISPGFYIASGRIGVRSDERELLRVCKVGDALWYDKLDGRFGDLSECDDDCLSSWLRVDVMPGIGSGLNYF